MREAASHNGFPSELSTYPRSQGADMAPVIAIGEDAIVKARMIGEAVVQRLGNQRVDGRETRADHEDGDPGARHGVRKAEEQISEHRDDDARQQQSSVTDARQAAAAQRDVRASAPGNSRREQRSPRPDWCRGDESETAAAIPRWPIHFRTERTAADRTDGRNAAQISQSLADAVLLFARRHGLRAPAEICCRRKERNR